MGETEAASILGLINKNNMDFNQLQSIRCAIDKAIMDKSHLVHPTPSRLDFSDRKDINNFIDYIPSFVDKDIEDLISAEIQSCNFSHKCKSDAVQNTFISSVEGSYEWGSSKGTVQNNSLDLENFPAVKSVMDKINTQFSCNLNSVLVSYYKSGDVSARLHNDNESTMAPSEPICVLSLGENRKVDFVFNGDAAYITSLQLIPDNASLYVMKPGTQEYFRHRVRKDKKLKRERVSLSFRCFKPDTPVAVVPESKLADNDPADRSVFQTPPENSGHGTDTPLRPSTHIHPSLTSSSTPLMSKAHTVLPVAEGFIPYIGHTDDSFPTSTGTAPKPQFRKLCLLLGTSITEGVIGEKMSRGSRTVINLSSSGFFIQDVERAAFEFCAESPSSIPQVDKIIINVGTNEIKNFNSFVKNVHDYFWSPLCNLAGRLKQWFPRAQLIFQSILPIRRWYKYNALSVISFNRLLVRLCRAHGCIFFDTFNLFLDVDEHDINWDLYTFSWRGRRFNQGIHLSQMGLSVLCRALKHAVYHNIYNPHPHSLPFDRYYYVD